MTTTRLSLWTLHSCFAPSAQPVLQLVSDGQEIATSCWEQLFCEAVGAQLLQDPTVIDLYGTPTLLMHGDSLCTRDE